MTANELKELKDISNSAVWNMCNEIACSDCHYYDHFNSLDDCPLNRLFDFVEKMQRESEAKHE